MGSPVKADTSDPEAVMVLVLKPNMGAECDSTTRLLKCTQQLVHILLIVCINLAFSCELKLSTSVISLEQ